MTKEKAQYKGQKLTGSMPKEIPKKLCNILKDLCPNKQPADPPWPSPADEFASLLINEARRAVSFLFSQEEHITKGQARAESDDLLKTLRSLNDKLNAGAEKLRCISPGLDRLLPIESDPLDCEEQMINCSQSLSILIKHLESASAKIECLPKSDKIDAKERWVAVELTVNVLDILKDYGIQGSAYASASDNESQSRAITILKAIGDCIGLAKAPVTWRDIIRDARKQALELQVVVDNPLGKGGMPD